MTLSDMNWQRKMCPHTIPPKFEGGHLSIKKEQQTFVMSTGNCDSVYSEFRM